MSKYELLSLQRKRERWERLSHRLGLFASAGRFPGFDPVWTLYRASELIWTSDMERQLYYLVALIGLRVSPKKLAMFQFKVGSFTCTQDENESAAGPKAHLLVCSPVCRQHKMSTEGSLGRGRMALGGGREQGLRVLGTQCGSSLDRACLVHSADSHALLFPWKARGGSGSRWWAKAKEFPSLLEEKSHGEIDLNPTPRRESQVKSVRRALSYKDV